MLVELLKPRTAEITSGAFQVGGAMWGVASMHMCRFWGCVVWRVMWEIPSSVSKSETVLRLLALWML